MPTSNTPPEPTTDPAAGGDPEPTTDPAGDGDGEIRDPARVLADNRKVRSENEKLRARLKDAEARAAKAAEIEEANKSDLEKAIDAARKEAREQAIAETQSVLIRAQVEARAARRFADPADAVALLGDLTELTDDDAIDAALDTLAEAKPYLLADGAPPPNTDPDLGRRGPTPKPTATNPPANPNEWIRAAAGRN